MADARSEGQRAQGPASPRAAVAAANPPRSTDTVYGALRSVVRGGAPIQATAPADTAVPCLSLGIRGLSTWPEAPERLEGRRARSSYAGRSQPEGRLDVVDDPDSVLRRAVIGQCLTVWDAAER